VEAAQSSAQPSAETTTKEWALGQRELLLPKSLQTQNSVDDKRNSISSRPPVSFKPLNSPTTATVPVRVPPIRAFRSSGSRRSLVLDMNTRTMNPYDFGDDFGDSNQRDRTLRALEGMPDDDMLQMTPPDSAEHSALDGDDTGDVFMKIAREESTRRVPDENAPLDDQSPVVSFFFFFFFFNFSSSPYSTASLFCPFPISSWFRDASLAPSPAGRALPVHRTFVTSSLSKFL
jgi:hypothetical protein